jgi:hypothetical protein
VTIDVLTWPVHGAYMRALAQVPVRWHLPVGSGRLGYGGAGTGWAGSIVEVPVEELGERRFDVVVYQHREHYDVDRWTVLDDAQRAAPVVYLEHDPPRMSPTDTVHPATEPGVTVVHVTAFNALMWDTRVPSVVIDHGVEVPLEPGELARDSGVVVINDLAARGRRLGWDVYLEARRDLPLELIGMGAAEVGGWGEVDPLTVAAFVAEHRFLFSPIRYTSLGLGILEAMAAGVPVIGLATTELPTVVRNGMEGFIDNDVRRLVAAGRRLVADRELAREMGARARARVAERFGVDRFVREWTELLTTVAAGGGIVAGAVG